VAGGDEISRDGALTGAGIGLLDPDALRSLGDLVGDDPEAMGELVEAFLDEAPTRLDELRAGMDDADAALVRRAAHTLKSNALTFGAAALGTLCQELETAGAAGRLDEAAPLVTRVVEEWSRVLPHLEELRASPSS
jgi:HPt (histidine-containing phosphotransfer) domain-containing protein